MWEVQRMRLKRQLKHIIIWGLTAEGITLSEEPAAMTPGSTAHKQVTGSENGNPRCTSQRIVKPRCSSSALAASLPFEFEFEEVKRTPLSEPTCFFEPLANLWERLSRANQDVCEDFLRKTRSLGESRRSLSESEKSTELLVAAEGKGVFAKVRPLTRPLRETSALTLRLRVGETQRMFAFGTAPFKEEADPLWGSLEQPLSISKLLAWCGERAILLLMTEDII